MTSDSEDGSGSGDDQPMRRGHESQDSDDEVQRSDVEESDDDVPAPPISRSPSPDGSQTKRQKGSPKESSEDEQVKSRHGSGSEDEKQQDKTTSKDIFGSDMSSEDEDDRPGRDSSSQERKVSSSSDEEESEKSKKMRDSHQAMREESYLHDMMEGEDELERQGDGEEAQLPDIEVEVDFPRLLADLGKEFNFVKFPNFLSVDTHPYDPNLYEDEIDEDEVMDEEGKGRLKLKVENTIRWRCTIDPNSGEEIKESNARIVKWSDGTSSLYLGSEIFDIYQQEMIQGENNHLFVRQGVGLQGQAVFRTKLSFRPHSTDSFTHRKMTLSLADKSQKTHKIRVLPQVGKDPEAHRSEMIKKEEDRLKASIRRENKIRRTRERAHGRGPSASYLEPDAYDEDDEDGISLSAIKNKFKHQRKEFASATYSDSDDGSDVEFGRRSSDKRKQARIEESDD